MRLLTFALMDRISNMTSDLKIKFRHRIEKYQMTCGCMIGHYNRSLMIYTTE